MSTAFFELNDNRFIGVKALEISAFPNASALCEKPEDGCKRIYQAFVHLTTELYKLCGADTCMELLWLTETAQNQTFASRIRVFSILRQIGNQKNVIERSLNSIHSNIATALSALQYSVQEVDVQSAEFLSLLGQVDSSSACGIVKSEKCAANANSLYPYYYSDIIPGNNYTNFNSLIATLSQCENCCISFQLFPVQMTAEELYLINESAAELGRIASGVMLERQIYRDALAAEPLKVYSYYNERRNSPMFLYNILAFGDRTSCASLATKIISLLQSGEDKVVTSDFSCYDLSGENIQLQKQFSYYVWNVNNRLLYSYRNMQIQANVMQAKKLFRLPYIVSAEEAASFYRLPLYEKTMAALKSRQIVQMQEQFAHAVVSKDNIRLGTLVTNDNSKITIGCSENALTKHALIVGTPGSGKTTFSIDLLLQFVKKNIPFLAIEPTKTEYRAMIDAIPNLQIFTPGNNAVSPFIINPFIPPRGIRIEQYIPSLASAFKAAFSMPSPLDMIFLKAIRTCYTQYGWKDYSEYGDPDVIPFGLHEFILVFKKLIKNTNYSSEVRGNIESAGLLRLENLIEQNSNIYDTVNTVPIEDLLTAPTVLELNSIDNAEQKSLIMALLLINICLYTKHRQSGDGKLKNAILIDEAHVLLGGKSMPSSDGNPDSQGTTIKALQDMIAEIRSYGTSLIIADQSPTKVSREVVANTDIKVTFHLVETADKKIIADSTNMDVDAQANLSRLEPGQAYVYYSRLESPQMVSNDDIREESGIRLNVSDKEIAERMTYWKEHRQMLIPYSECRYCKQCQEGCDFKIRSDAEYLANSALNKYISSVNSLDTIKKCLFHLPNLMEKEFSSFPEANTGKLQTCTRIKLYRKLTLELPYTLSENEQKIVFSQFPKKKEQEA